MDALTPPNITLSTAQMIEVDRAMLEDYHISLIQMMENAGRSLALLARERFLGGDPRGKNVFVLAGTGGNGGGALVSVRRLHNWGAQLTVVLSKPAGEYHGVPAQQLDSLQRMGIPLLDHGSFHANKSANLVVDGLIGYNLSGAPRGTTARLIEWANGQKAPILSLDVPSGLDSTTGISHVPTIRAAATLTLALPKTGLLKSEASRFVGELYLADISVPPELYKKALGLTIPALFAQNEIIKLKA